MPTAVKQQHEIDVYADEDGQVVITQATTPDAPINYVVLLPQNAEALIRALREAKHEALGGWTRV